MKKMESTLKNMLLSLTGFSLVAGGMLGWINALTDGPIEQARQQTLREAIAQVLPTFDNNPMHTVQTLQEGGYTYKIYRATLRGKDVGTAVEVEAAGFGGQMVVLVGFDPSGNICDYSLLSHSETPGLGAKADTWFKQGEKGDITGLNPGKQPLSVTKDGGQVDAITASTITSRAFLQAVNRAYAICTKGHTDTTTGASCRYKSSAHLADSIQIHSKVTSNE